MFYEALSDVATMVVEGQEITQGMIDDLEKFHHVMHDQFQVHDVNNNNDHNEDTCAYEDYFTEEETKLLEDSWDDGDSDATSCDTDGY